MSSRGRNGSRSRELAAIYRFRRQLKLSDEAYVMLLAKVSAATGKVVRSAAQLRPCQRQAMLQELRRLKCAHLARDPLARLERLKVLAQIKVALHALSRSWSYADALGKQQTGIERVAWMVDLDHLRTVAETLRVEQEMLELDAAVVTELSRLNMAPAMVVEILRPLRPHWRRHRASLRLVLAFLRSLSSESMDVTQPGGARSDLCGQ